MYRWHGGPNGSEYIGGYPTRDIDDAEWATLDPSWADVAATIYAVVEGDTGSPAAPPPPPPAAAAEPGTNDAAAAADAEEA